MSAYYNEEYFLMFKQSDQVLPGNNSSGRATDGMSGTEPTSFLATSCCSQTSARLNIFIESCIEVMTP